MSSALPTAPRRKRGPEAAAAATRFFEDDPTEHVEPCVDEIVDAAQAADTRALNRDGLLRALSLLETKEREVSRPETAHSNSSDPGQYVWEALSLSHSNAESSRHPTRAQHPFYVPCASWAQCESRWR